MIECVNGNGMGCCDICLHIRGWHREWNSHLYYVLNKSGLYLRRCGQGDVFSTDLYLSKSVFCYDHARETEQQRILQSDWEWDEKHG